MSQIPPTTSQGPMNPPSPPGQGSAIASLVLGIISLFFCIWYLSVPAGIAGLICALVSKNRTGIRKAGLICSIVGLVLSVLWVLVIGAIIVAALSAGAGAAAGGGGGTP